MIEVRCHLLDHPDSVEVIRLDDEDELYQAPDRFVASHLASGRPGDVCFVWAEYLGVTVLWRCEVMMGPKPLVLFTYKVTEGEARLEVKESLEIKEEG